MLIPIAALRNQAWKLINYSNEFFLFVQSVGSWLTSDLAPLSNTIPCPVMRLLCVPTAARLFVKLPRTKLYRSEAMLPISDNSCRFFNAIAPHRLALRITFTSSSLKVCDFYLRYNILATNALRLIYDSNKILHFSRLIAVSVLGSNLGNVSTRRTSQGGECGGHAHTFSLIFVNNMKGVFRGYTLLTCFDIFCASRVLCVSRFIAFSNRPEILKWMHYIIDRIHIHSISSRLEHHCTLGVQKRLGTEIVTRHKPTRCNEIQNYVKIC